MFPKEVPVSTDLTSVSTDPLTVQQPEKLLSTRIIRRGVNRVKQVLVQWSSMPPEMATWEDEADVPREQVQEQQTEDSLNLKAGGVSQYDRRGPSISD